MDMSEVENTMSGSLKRIRIVSECKMGYTALDGDDDCEWLCCPLPSDAAHITAR